MWSGLALQAHEGNQEVPLLWNISFPHSLSSLYDVVMQRGYKLTRHFQPHEVTVLSVALYMFVGYSGILQAQFRIVFFWL
jgi:hypothetical protein